MKRLAQTLVVDAQGGRILLAFHKSGDMEGCYTGFLDTLREGEHPEDGAGRITNEQCGLTVEHAELRAIFCFTGADYPGADEYEYYACSYGGKLRETAQVQPQWFRLDLIPYERMPADDALWYPAFLDGKRQRGSFHFGPGMKDLERYELSEVQALELPGPV